MSINDQTDYIQGFIDEIYNVLNSYKDFIGCNIIEKTDDAFLPRFPAITIDLDSFSEEWKEIPRRKVLTGNFSISYFFGNINDKNMRQGVRSGMGKICNVFREQWTLNGYCPQLGIRTTSAIPYVFMKDSNIIAGAVITLQAKKVVDVVVS